MNSTQASIWFNNILYLFLKLNDVFMIHFVDAKGSTVFFLKVLNLSYKHDKGLTNSQDMRSPLSVYVH